MTAQHKLLKAVHDGGDGEAVLEPVFEVAVFVELGVQPALLKRLGVGGQLVVLTARHDGVVGRFGGQHAGLDGGVAAFDAADVQVTGVTTDQRAARFRRSTRLARRNQRHPADRAIARLLLDDLRVHPAGPKLLGRGERAAHRGSPDRELPGRGRDDLERLAAGRARPARGAPRS